MNFIIDNEDDCGDNSDEQVNCPAQPFSCPAGQMRCLGTLDICINQTQLCDGKQDCPDGVEEGPFCSRDDCSVRNGGCSHICRSSPIGAICFCPNGYATTNSTNYKKCEDFNECNLETSCSQKCANFNGGYNCACEEGKLPPFPLWYCKI